MGTKVIRKIIRYELDFDRSLNYLKENLGDLNTLSKELLNTIDFRLGRFFTLLLENSDLERLYEFKAGHVLPQNPEIEYFVKGRKASYSIIPTIQDEVARFLLREMKKNKKLICIFDDFLRSPITPSLKEKDLKEQIIVHDKEVYYLLRHAEASIKRLCVCIKQSNVIWHSLCVLSTYDCNICMQANPKIENFVNPDAQDFWTKQSFSESMKINARCNKTETAKKDESPVSEFQCEYKRISLDQIKKISLNAQLIMLGAYDGEGYIFWERRLEPV